MGDHRAKMAEAEAIADLIVRELKRLDPQSHVQHDRGSRGLRRVTIDGNFDLIRIARAIRDRQKPSGAGTKQ